MYDDLKDLVILLYYSALLIISISINWVGEYLSQGFLLVVHNGTSYQDLSFSIKYEH